MSYLSWDAFFHKNNCIIKVDDIYGVLGTVLSTSHILVHVILTTILWESGAERVSYLLDRGSSYMYVVGSRVEIVCFQSLVLNNHLILFQCITYYTPSLRNKEIILVVKSKLLVIAIEFENSPIMKTRWSGTLLEKFKSK